MQHLEDFLTFELKYNGNTSLYELAQAVAESDIVKQQSIKIMVDRGGSVWPDRIVFLDRYDLASEVEITGCPCCYFPDYVIHFSTKIMTMQGETKVHLRTEDWAKEKTIDESYHHATARNPKFPDFPNREKSIKRIPDVLEFYRNKGVPAVLLEDLEQQLNDCMSLMDW